MKKDEIYRRPLARIADFSFDESVAEVFDDMIERSVPGYRAVLTLIETITERYAQPDSRLYDLGCSLGAAALAMAQGVKTADIPGCRITAVDNAPAMVRRCRERMQKAQPFIPVDVVEADIRETEIHDASVVVLNFTLQFLPPADRAALLCRIARGMRPGGVLVLSEKIRFEDSDMERTMTELHHEFKRAHGYSELEISRKRAALENVLIPETIAAHRRRIAEAGFRSCEVWFQCFNFMSMLARR